MKITLAFLLAAATARASASTCAPAITSDAPLSQSQKREITTMTEDMASEWRTDFENGQPPNDVLIRFGIYQTALRRPKLLHAGKSSNKVRLAASHVRDVAQRYFGRVPRHRSLGFDKAQGIYDWTYRGGFYHGFSEMFEQQEVEKVKLIRVIGAARSTMTVRADFVDGMATATGAREAVVKIQMALKKVGSARHSHLIVWSFHSLTPQP